MNQQNPHNIQPQQPMPQQQQQMGQQMQGQQQYGAPPQNNQNNSYTYNPNQNYQNQANNAQYTPGQLRAMEIQEVSKRIPKHAGSPFGLEFRPRDIRFATQDKDERVFILVRRHWITNIDWAIANVLFGLIPFFVFPFLSFFDLGLEVSAGLQFLFVIFFYSLVFTNVFREFIDWYYDIYIVTNDKILSYEFTPFTSYTVKEAMLTNIEQVQESSAGLIAGIFNYGNVSLSTASEDGNFRFNKIPNPTLLRDVIADLTEIAKKYSK